MERKITHDIDLNLEETELRLGLPGTMTEDPKEMPAPVARSNKRASQEFAEESNRHKHPATKEQVVGWPPIRSYWKNSLQVKKVKAESGRMYVKVSMDGAPYLRKMDLNVYKSYPELLKALENMFECAIGDYSERDGYNGSKYAATYEDKDGDWMLVGDVPWEMFHGSCKRLRIMKGSEARGLGCP